LSGSERPSERPVVCDTVVVNYFLAVGQIELLTQLLGGSVQIPRTVFDPEEPDDIADEAASELRQGLRLHRRRTEGDGVGGELRARSERALPHFERLPALAREGPLAILEMTADELALYAQLRDRQHVRQYGLIVGLGRGEAAALAIALTREFDVATDDQDAIRVLQAISPELRALRIRRLLIDARDAGLIDTDAAREIHGAIRNAGVWDSGTIE
jgi:predicted nucleic acid-binding protein